ncbi:hypothetical protein ASE04_28935 [Rhizobium sp. Root708]|nr:hypothetical protein ASE04_28935 [Rhizobium sp. Root708]
MREYLRMPTVVEVVCARELIGFEKGSWGAFPEWVRECYERMVISAASVTLFNPTEALKAQTGHFIVRDQHGALSVHHEVTFHRDFAPVHTGELHKLHAA